MPRRRQSTGVWTVPIMEAIDAAWKNKKVPPTMREIEEATGVTSKSVISYEFRRLAENGLIEIIDGKAVPKWVIARLNKP